MTEERKPVTLHRLREMHAAGDKIAMLTCYDATFARLLDECGVDVLLVGDSLGMVLQGQPSTLPVSLDDMAYHTRCVARGNRSAWIVADLPFGELSRIARAGAAQRGRIDASRRAHGQARRRRLDDADSCAASSSAASRCARISVSCRSRCMRSAAIASRVATTQRRRRCARHAIALAEAGAQMLVLELVPAALARELVAQLPMPVIGIGAGAACSGQVLVLHDMLDLTHGKRPRFVRNFMHGSASVRDAVRRYVADVKRSAFPDDTQHAY